jgi:hypothetical protein
LNKALAVIVPIVDRDYPLVLKLEKDSQRLLVNEANYFIQILMFLKRKID